MENDQSNEKVGQQFVHFRQDAPSPVAFLLACFLGVRLRWSDRGDGNCGNPDERPRSMAIPVAVAPTRLAAMPSRSTRLMTGW